MKKMRALASRFVGLREAADRVDPTRKGPGREEREYSSRAEAGAEMIGRSCFGWTSNYHMTV
jgi:hypothetical protein